MFLNLGIRESNASLQIGSSIIKFGNSGATVPPNGYQFSFPTPFPNACYALVVTGWQKPMGHTGRNKVGATLTVSDNIASTGFDYIAIGG
ncbi:gp53-like domain-containing protein [Citrobacter braakii]